MTGRVLVELPAHAGAATWIRLGAEGLVEARGTLPGEGEGEGEGFGGEPGDYIVAAVPGAACAVHWLTLAGTTPAQMRAEALFQLEAQLAAPTETLHIAVADVAEMDGRRCVVAAARSDMDRWQAALSAHGVAADVLVPAPLLLPHPEVGYVTAGAGPDVDVRGAFEAFSVPPDLVETIIADSSVEVLPPRRGEAARLAGSELPLVNLLQGAYAPVRRVSDPGRRRRLTLSLAAAAILALLAVGVDGLRHQGAADAVRAKLRADATAAGAELAAGADPLPALRLAAAERGTGGGIQRASQVLFSAVRAAPGTTIEAMEWRSGRLLATLSLPVAASSEALRPGVEAAGLRLIGGTPEPMEGGKRRETVEIAP